MKFKNRQTIVLEIRMMVTFEEEWGNKDWDGAWGDALEVLEMLHIFTSQQAVLMIDAFFSVCTYIDTSIKTFIRICAKTCTGEKYYLIFTLILWDSRVPIL